MQRPLLLLSAACLAAGCALHRVERDPAPPVEPPPAFSATGEERAPERWWTAFGETDLDRLVEQALAANLELRIAWARVRQAEAIARQAGAARWPQLDLQLAAARERRFFDIGIDEFNFTTNSFSASLAAGYELDLWDRVGSTRAAAVLEARAVDDDAQAAAITLSAAVAESYFDLLRQRALIDLLGRQAELNRTWARLVELRFREGLSPVLDVLQQRQQLEEIEAELEVARGTLATVEQQLAVLLGKAPGGLDLPAGDELPMLPPLPDTGIPADLLERRPDLRAARSRV
ncbi:MAG: TolC family protein, partial [Actinomycetes bacterium]|nr:TolC family protein [Actinomycetes bacterium]